MKKQTKKSSLIPKRDPPANAGARWLIPAFGVLIFGTLAASVFLSKGRVPFADGSPKDVAFLLSPLLIVFMSPLFSTLFLLFLSALRNRFYPLILCNVFSPTGVFLLVAAATRESLWLIPAGVLFLFGLLYLWFMKTRIKIASITLKNTFIAADRSAFAHASSQALPLFLHSAANLAIIAATVLLSYALKHTSENETEIISLLGVLDLAMLFSWFYVRSLASGVAYIFGARFIKKVFETGESLRSLNDASYMSRTHSLGSVALASLLVATIKTLQALHNKKGRNNQSQGIGGLILNAIIGCFLALLKEFVEFLTVQAYVYCAFYGKGILESGRMAMENFRSTAIERYINMSIADDIILWMGVMFSLAVSVLVVGASFFFTAVLGRNNFDKSDEQIFLFHLLLFFALITSLVSAISSAASLIGGGCAAQIALYKEDPELMEKACPNYDKLKKHLEK